MDIRPNLLFSFTAASLDVIEGTKSLEKNRWTSEGKAKCRVRQALLHDLSGKTFQALHAIIVRVANQCHE